MEEILLMTVLMITVTNVVSLLVIVLVSEESDVDSSTTGDSDGEDVAFWVVCSVAEIALADCSGSWESIEVEFEVDGIGLPTLVDVSDVVPDDSAEDEVAEEEAEEADGEAGGVEGREVESRGVEGTVADP